MCGDMCMPHLSRAEYCSIALAAGTGRRHFVDILTNPCYVGEVIFEFPSETAVVVTSLSSAASISNSIQVSIMIGSY